jgi:hypothetical protein
VRTEARWALAGKIAASAAVRRRGS